MSSSQSRRVKQRAHRALHVTNTCNNISSSLNQLHSSFSTSLDSISSFAFKPAVASRITTHIRNSATRFCSATRPSSASLVAADVCEGEHWLPVSVPTTDNDFVSQQQQSSSSSSLDYAALSAPVSLSASKVSLPSVAGTASLLDLLPPDLAHSYADPRTMLKRPCEQLSTAARVPVIDQDEYERLIVRMLSVGMVSFTRTPAVVNGVFVVPKDTNSQRLIIDARAANSIFATPSRVELPTPDIFSRLTADATRPFFVAGDDADNFYHRIRLPISWVPYFALPRVRTRAVGVAAEWGDGWIYPCCTTLPMGFSHSVLLAQRVHEQVIYTRTSLQRHDRISRSTDVNIDRLRHAIYIDDLALIGYDPVSMAVVQAEYATAMFSVGLPTKPSKHQPPSCDGVKVLGLIFHGREGTVGVAVNDLHLLITATHELLTRPFVTGRDLARIVGRWTWAALPTRPILSVLSAVYRYSQLIRGGHAVLWPSVRRELRILCTLAPLMYASLTAPWLSNLCAVDASMVGEGVAAATISQPISAAVAAHAGSVVSPIPAVTERVIHDSNWKPIISHPWERTHEHINVLECRAALAAVRWSLSLPRITHTRSRLLLLSDSSVVTCALSKGRSSSRPLLSRIRCIAALLLGSGTHLYVHWIPSELNVADSLSRLA